MRWAEIVDGVVARITVSNDEEFGADWLIANVGGLWVAVPDNVEAGPRWLYEDGVFSPPPSPVGV